MSRMILNNSGNDSSLKGKLKKHKKMLVVVFLLLAVIWGGYYLLTFVKNNKQIIGIKSLSALSKVSSLLPISRDEQKELDVLNQLVQAFTKKDGVTRTFLVLLQNNMELRPGGGFLGQYAIIKIKDGDVLSSSFEDANLLDQRIQAKIATPYPFKRKLQLKNWKFRDSNFSPDFPTNVEKAKYFYRLSGRGGDFDGVFAVNATVLNDVLKITGPLTVPGYGVEFNSENGFLKLEEVVEKKYILNPELDTQSRKDIMRKLTPILIDKLVSLGNVTKIAELAHKEFQNKNVMVNFKDSNLQSLAESVHWDGAVSKDWGGDYLMMVDANMGALKTDYYIKRSINYDVDLTQEKPLVKLDMIYQNTAPYGDWRTSDYHSYVRVYVPKGSVMLDRKMLGAPITNEEFGKTYFGFFVDVVMGTTVTGHVEYNLPADFPRDDYKLLIQKQSGVGDVPVHVHLKTKDGEFDQDQTMQGDLKFQFTK